MDKPKNATVALIFGILAVLFSTIPLFVIFGFACAMAATIMGSKGMAKGQRFARTAFILSIVSYLIMVVTVVGCTTGLAEIVQSAGNA